MKNAYPKTTSHSATFPTPPLTQPLPSPTTPSHHVGDCAGMLPTLDTNLATPESFTPFCPPVQKLVHIIQNTKKPNHKHTAPFMQQ